MVNMQFICSRQIFFAAVAAAVLIGTASGDGASSLTEASMAMTGETVGIPEKGAEQASLVSPLTNNTFESWNNHTAYGEEQENESLEEQEDEEEYEYLEEEDFYEAEEGPGFDFGVVQIIESQEASLTLERTQEYYNELIMEYDMLKDVCYNYNEMCTGWAADSECEKNPAFMNEHCAPACQTCDLLHYETRCASNPLDPVAWQRGDLNAMFENILKSYDAKTWSRPSYVEGDIESGVANHNIGPWIVSIENFITAEEANMLIHMGKQQGYERSVTVGEVDEETGETEGATVEDRTSKNSWCGEECQNDPVVAQVLERIQNLTGISMENSEPLQLLKYEEGEYYNTHSDYIDYEWNAIQGPRIFTAYIYLNDVEEGGETRFDWFDLKVTPKQGRLVIWPNVLDEDPTEVDERTTHEAMPVITGVKYGANAWVHLRSRQKAIELDC